MFKYNELIIIFSYARALHFFRTITNVFAASIIRRSKPWFSPPTHRNPFCSLWLYSITYILYLLPAAPRTAVVGLTPHDRSRRQVSPTGGCSGTAHGLDRFDRINKRFRSCTLVRAVICISRVYPVRVKHSGFGDSFGPKVSTTHAS